MAALLYLCILLTQVASIKVDVPRDKPSVVILFVGRSLTSRLDATHGSSNIFDLMTGEEEDVDVGSQPSDSSSNARASDSSGWGNVVEMLIEPVKKTHTVDVFICVDRKIGVVPAAVSQVFEIEAISQEQRGAKCVSKLSDSNRQYDWLIKARSDFVFYKKFPAMTSFQAGYVYTRFRAIGGVTGITSDHISFLPCSQNCAGGPRGHIGYVNDDMVRLVPGDLMDFAFLDSASHSTSATWDGKPLLHMPENWIDMIGTEGQLTRFWLERGILTKPLSCPGYPKHDRYGQHDKSLKCASKPVELVNCPPNEPIESAHRTLCAGNPSSIGRC